MNILTQLGQNSRKHHWREGVTWLAWSLIGGLLPIWLTIVGLYLTKQQIRLPVFTDNGEFALYTASYAAGTLYLLFRDLKNSAFPSRALLGLLYCVLLLVAASVFMVVVLLGVIGNSGQPELLAILDKEALRRVSLFMFPVSIVFALLVVVADNMRTMPDIEGIAAQNFADLNEDFDNLNNGNQ